ncbi:hypothetical protein [Saccharopolyspora tripterygii]
MARSSDQHREAAESYLARVEKRIGYDETVQRDLMLAQVHATLALASEDRAQTYSFPSKPGLAGKRGGHDRS